MDLGSAEYVEVVDVRGILLTSGTSDEFDIEYSDDGSAWTKLVDIPLLGIKRTRLPIKAGVNKRYWRIAKTTATDLSTAKVTLSDFNLFNESATASNVKLLDFSVESDRHYLLILTDKNIRSY